MLVTVVAGNPAVIGLELRASSDRNGAAAGWSRSSSQPRPSTISRHARGVSGRPSGLLSPGTESDPSRDDARSGSVLSPYGGSAGWIPSSSVIDGRPPCRVGRGFEVCALFAASPIIVPQLPPG